LEVKNEMISKKDVYMLNAKTSVRVPMMKLSLLRELRQQLKDNLFREYHDLFISEIVDATLSVEGEK